MKIHLIGVAGSGMGQLAMLLAEAGHDVRGSDAAFDPPMGPALEAAGIRCSKGYVAEHVSPDLDLVVVGNAIRKDNPEVLEAERLGCARTSMSAALRERFLERRRPLVVCGTHGKTTTSAMGAWILSQAGCDPGWFIGGIPKNLDRGARIGSTKRKLVGNRADVAPFVVEGDEYDAVFWNKKPKFLDYVGVSDRDVVIVTSVEHDHVDIYPTASAYESAFTELFERLDENAIACVDARDARARALARTHARSKVVFYALDGDDTGDVEPAWIAALAPSDPTSGLQPFDLYGRGSSCGRYAIAVPGAHNVRNAVAAIAACAEGFAISPTAARTALASFAGVRRRQELLGRPADVAVYDDFAHHPTAVDETLRALRTRHRKGTLWAVFEPRSATACRNTHQDGYLGAFGAADRVVIAPLGRSNIPEAERLDIARLVHGLGEKAEAAPSVEAILERLVGDARAGDAIALLSNGAFGGLHARLLAALAARNAG